MPPFIDDSSQLRRCFLSIAGGLRFGPVGFDLHQGLVDDRRWRRAHSPRAGGRWFPFRALRNSLHFLRIGFDLLQVGGQFDA